jgi:L-fucose/D-arabinose isomerase
MKRARVGILTFSDGRPHTHESLWPITNGFQERLGARLEEAGWDVVSGREIVWTTELAQQEARYLAAQGVEAVVFNYSIWAFPHFSAIASEFVPHPVLLSVT